VFLPWREGLLRSITLRTFPLAEIELGNRDEALELIGVFFKLIEGSVATSSVFGWETVNGYYLYLNAMI